MESKVTKFLVRGKRLSGLISKERLAPVRVNLKSTFQPLISMGREHATFVVAGTDRASEIISGGKCGAMLPAMRVTACDDQGKVSCVERRA